MAGPSNNPECCIANELPKLTLHLEGAKVGHHCSRLLLILLDRMDFEAGIHEALDVSSGARAENHHIGMGLAVVLAEVLSKVWWFLANFDIHTCAGLDVGALARADQDVVALEDASWRYFRASCSQCHQHLGSLPPQGLRCIVVVAAEAQVLNALLWIDSSFVHYL
jgi:hypothetical protein